MLIRYNRNRKILRKMIAREIKRSLKLMLANSVRYGGGRKKEKKKEKKESDTVAMSRIFDPLKDQATRVKDFDLTAYRKMGQTSRNLFKKETGIHRVVQSCGRLHSSLNKIIATQNRWMEGAVHGILAPRK